jgi:hypothetical protein
MQHKKAHALYCHLWPTRLHCIIPRYLINGTTFRKTLLNQICVFWFSLQTCLKFSHSKQNSARYYHKHTYAFLHNARYSCYILMKLDLSRHIFEKFSNIKLSIGSQVVQWGQTDRRGGRHDEANCVFFLGNFANASKNRLIYPCLQWTVPAFQHWKRDCFLYPMVNCLFCSISVSKICVAESWQR